MKKKYCLHNCDYARISIDHKRKRVIMSTPVKEPIWKIIFFNCLSLWLLIIITFFIINFIPLNKLSDILSIHKNSDFFTKSIIIFSLAEFFISIMFFPPFFITLKFFNNPKLIEKIPEIRANLERLFRNTNYCIIRKKKLNSKIFEIPVFGNIFLDYKTKGDFKKFLKKFSIKEYEFKYVYFPFFGKKIKKTQTFYWKATFEFEEIPKKGELVIQFL